MRGYAPAPPLSSGLSSLRHAPGVSFFQTPGRPQMGVLGVRPRAEFSQSENFRVNPCKLPLTRFTRGAFLCRVRCHD
jgi:hypothetical protein